jgi:hypothetical protein
MKRSHSIPHLERYPRANEPFWLFASESKSQLISRMSHSLLSQVFTTPLPDPDWSESINRELRSRFGLSRESAKRLNQHLENSFFESDSSGHSEDILESEDPEHPVIPDNSLEHEVISITSTPPLSPSKMSRSGPGSVSHAGSSPSSYPDTRPPGSVLNHGKMVSDSGGGNRPRFVTYEDGHKCYLGTDGEIVDDGVKPPDNRPSRSTAYKSIYSTLKRNTVPSDEQLLAHRREYGYISANLLEMIARVKNGEPAVLVKQEKGKGPAVPQTSEIDPLAPPGSLTFTQPLAPSTPRRIDPAAFQYLTYHQSSSLDGAFPIAVHLSLYEAVLIENRRKELNMIPEGAPSHHLSIPLREVTLPVTLPVPGPFTLPAPVPVALPIPGPVTLPVHGPVSSRRTPSRSRSRSRSRYRSYRDRSRRGRSRHRTRHHRHRSPSSSRSRSPKREPSR